MYFSFISTFVLATKVLSRFSQNWFASHPVSTLNFTVTHMAIMISECQVKVLSKFVIWRIVLQHPIQVVDIPDLAAATRVWTFDGIAGLQVIVRAEP